MEAFVCQAADVKNAEIITEEHVQQDSISTLTSNEMSFVGGGCLAVAFA